MKTVIVGIASCKYELGSYKDVEIAREVVKGLDIFYKEILRVHASCPFAVYTPEEWGRL